MTTTTLGLDMDLEPDPKGPLKEGLCKLCNGFGALMCVQNGDYEWHSCPACDAAGTRNPWRGPPFIKMHSISSSNDAKRSGSP